MAAEDALRPCPLAPLLVDDRSRLFILQAMGAQPDPDQAENLLSAWWLLVRDPGLPVSPGAVEKLKTLINAARPKFWSTLGQCYIETVVEGDGRGDAGINRTAGGMMAALQAFVLDPRISSATEVNAYWEIGGEPAEPLRAKRRRLGPGPAADEQCEDERPSKDQPQLIAPWRGTIDPECKAFQAGDAVMPASLALLGGASLYPLILPLH